MKSALGNIGNAGERIGEPGQWVDIVELCRANQRVHEGGALIRSASDALSRGCGQIDLMINRGQAVRKQWHVRAWIAASGVLAGVVLWSFLPGAVARAMPEDYAVPQRLAARLIGTDRWHAGEAMMNSADPVRWRHIVTAAASQEQQDELAAPPRNRDR